MEEGVPKSTQWARDNKEKVNLATKLRRGTLDGKLISMLNQSKYRSKIHNLEHNLSLSYVIGLYTGQEGKCALSGLNMTIQGERGTSEYWHSISLDRIDSSEGYIEGNVQLVCTGVNYMKKDMTDNMFINFCKNVASNHG
jgi:hypothetical protein